jgi:hypothetical protein
VPSPKRKRVLGDCNWQKLSFFKVMVFFSLRPPCLLPREECTVPLINTYTSFFYLSAHSSVNC